ncbi:Fic family protein [Steroidobacter cummioxidans]|uniref:Fic family protein n=1 Tax=Steroidobacter cummioxidans TaxID=1803913 RepID=UPI000E322622|nr:Fic family protein [Steroidobacter cummioxidans]
MVRTDSNQEPVAIGQEWLRRELSLDVPAPAVESYIIQGARRTAVHGARTCEFFPRHYAVDATLASHLRFALRHEPIDLGVLVAALKTMQPAEIETWVRAEPTGAYSRRAWFFYETFTGRTLDLEDARNGNYVDALDSARHVVADGRKSPRHRVIDNLLGTSGLCPMVRRTARLSAQMGTRIDEEARALIQSYDPVTLSRAVNYLYTKETRSSFAIEGETPSSSRTERFVAALKAAPTFTLNKESLIQLQGQIVDPRYAAHDWRSFQNFVGNTVSGYREEVHFICPRPQDVAGLMNAWLAMMTRLEQGSVDPVIAAAISAFAFVFVHPFADGNGRIHRFLMHHALAKRAYSPAGVIFPISAAILRDRRSYDQVLETFSKPLGEFIDWHWTPEQEIAIGNETADLYRYFDATLFAEYLYDRVADTVRRDLKEELGFVAVFDRAFIAVREIVDMPDRRASLFVRLCMQNGGRLSAAKRSQFPELSDPEVTQLEAQVQGAISAEAAAHS